jgi:hypothetical protein
MNSSRRRLTVAATLLGLNFALQAQEKADHIVITEVFLSRDRPSACWVEVHNPTDTELILERFRISHIRTMNVLGKVIREKGEISLLAGKSLVLCADISEFRALFGDHPNTLEVASLAPLPLGGFMAVRTRSCAEYPGIVVRYGDPALSLRIQGLAGCDVVPFSTGNETYSRRVTGRLGLLSVSRFEEALPTPGYAGNGE